MIERVLTTAATVAVFGLVLVAFFLCIRYGLQGRKPRQLPLPKLGGGSPKQLKRIVKPAGGRR